MVYFPNEIINLTLSFRENHPTAEIINPVIKKYKTQYIFTEDELKDFKDFKIRLIDFNEHYFSTLKYHKKQLYSTVGFSSSNKVFLELIMKIPNDESTIYVLTICRSILRDDSNAIDKRVCRKRDSCLYGEGD